MQTPVHLNELVAAEVRAEMARQRKTAGALASQLDCTSRTTYRLLSGQHTIDLRQLEVIAGFLGLEPVQLITRATAQVTAA